MYLNFRKINSSKRDAPMLRLQTMGGKELGPVPFVSGLKFELNYSDLSTIEFSVPYQVNGLLNPLYGTLSGYKIIYTEELGVYVITAPEKNGDGTKEVKTIKGYSLEYMLQKKDLYLQEGTYNFWNPILPGETILGRIVELDPNWSVGYVAPRLIGCYRTFDEYNDSALGFLYGDAMEKYRCAVVFDVYNKTINAYDAGDDTGSLPIYLDYNNLVKEVKVEEVLDDMATKLHVFGGGDLSIRPVNPINGDYLVDLSYFLNNGDLDVIPEGSTEKLSDKVRRWRADVASIQPYYTGIVSLRSSSTARKLAENAKLADLNGALQTLTAQQSVYIQEYALEKTDAGKASKQAQLNTIASQIEAKNQEIATKKTEIANIQAEIDGYDDKIRAVAYPMSIAGGTLRNGTKVSGYFTENEQKILTSYLIEGELTEETFVVTDTNASNTATLSTVSGNVSITDSQISRVTLTEFSRTMYTLMGGSISIPNAKLTAGIVRGTLDIKGGSAYTLTAYLGTIKYSNHDFDSGMITITGNLSGLSSDISAVTEENITQYLGSRVSFRTTGASAYFTIASNDFQEYSVALELYRFGMEALSDYAWPVYEFNISTANFLYQEKFEPFKNKLELGKSVHLRLGSEGLICPKIIGVELDFSDITQFNLIFSNRYQRRNELEYLQDELRGAGRSGKKFDASKYLYDRTADKMTSVTEYMNDMLDAAVQTIKGAKNQSVIIDGAGIHVSTTDTTNGNDKIQLRIVNGMIAMTNDGWKTAKLAIGRFYSKAHTRNGVNVPGMDVWGVNAELIAGSLIIGSNLFIETQGGYFTVDDSGVYINALKFYINNGKNLQNTLDDIGDDISGVGDKVSDVRKDVDAVTTKTNNGIVLNASDLSGVINATKAKMQNGGGNVLFDSDGIWLLNNTTKATSTKAIWMNEHGMLFGSGSRTPNPATSSAWTWTTAIDHDGITTDALRSKTLNSATIVGGEITIGKTSTSDNGYLYVDTNGNLGIGRNTSKTKGYNFYVDYNGNMYATSGEFGGKLVAATGTFSGALSAATGTFSGDISASSGTFKGTIRAADIQDKNGVSIFSGGSNSTLGKIKESYLTLDGISATFNKTITDEIKGVTTNYQAEIKASAQSLTTTFNKQISDVNGTIALTKSEFKQTADAITATVTENKKDADGKISTVQSTATQAADRISWIVKSGTSSSSMTLTSDAIKLFSDKILVTGAISWANLDSAAQKKVTDAQTKADTAEDTVKKIANGQYSGGTFIDGTKIYAPEIYAGKNSGRIISVTTSGISIYNSVGFKCLTISSDGANSLLTGSDNTMKISSGTISLMGHVAFRDNYNVNFGRANVYFSNANVIGLNVTAKFA